MVASLSQLTTHTSNNIQSLLQEIMDIVQHKAPHLEELFNVFAQEACTGRAWLAENLACLTHGARILEVGAGLMLLSCQLTKEGFAVSSLEPLGDGFSSFIELQKIVLAYAEKNNIMPMVIPIAVEQLTLENEFDFAFSINVMEHVSDVSIALERTIHAIRPGAEYRFICPNYLFPYEPHFNIPIIFSKSLTEKLLRRRIYDNTRVGDPTGLWKSLNWITVSKVLKTVQRMPDVSFYFDRTILKTLLTRVTNDKEFSNRRSPWIRKCAHLIVSLGLHQLVEWIPPIVQPAMDCTIKRKNKIV